MWKAPPRPKHEISNSYNDGVLDIYGVEDQAKPGYKPVEKHVIVCTLRYEERKLGIQRYYQGKQNQIEVSRVLRVPIPAGIELTNQQIAVTENGTKYRIRMVQRVKDVYPPSYDLTLERYAQNERNPL